MTDAGTYSPLRPLENSDTTRLASIAAEQIAADNWLLRLTQSGSGHTTWVFDIFLSSIGKLLSAPGTAAGRPIVHLSFPESANTEWVDGDHL